MRAEPPVSIISPMTDMQTSELIALGLDREAIAAATSRTNNGDAVDGVQQLDEIIPMLRGLVAGLSAEDLDRPTPCANFDVSGVLEHMIGGATAFAPAFRGDAAGTPATGTVFQRWSAAMDELADAVHCDGAQERTIESPFGAVPGAMFARYVAFDGLVHASDLAIATNQICAPRDEIVAAVDAFARDLLKPEMRDGDTFATETTPPTDATPLERLAAFSGRTVGNHR